MLFMQNTCHQVNSYPNNHSHDQHSLDHSNIESFRLVVLVVHLVVHLVHIESFHLVLEFGSRLTEEEEKRGGFEPPDQEIQVLQPTKS